MPSFLPEIATSESVEKECETNSALSTPTNTATLNTVALKAITSTSKPSKADVTLSADQNASTTKQWILSHVASSYLDDDDDDDDDHNLDSRASDESEQDIDAELERMFGRASNKPSLKEGSKRAHKVSEIDSPRTHQQSHDRVGSSSRKGGDINSEFKQVSSKVKNLEQALKSFKASKNGKKVNETMLELKTLEARLAAIRLDKAFDASLLLRPKETAPPLRVEEHSVQEQAGLGEQGIGQHMDMIEKCHEKSNPSVDIESSLDDEDTLGSMFDEPPNDDTQGNTGTATMRSANLASSTVISRQEFDTAGWTGMLPKDLLDEWCRKQHGSQSRMCDSIPIVHDLI